ncbi:phosphatidylglycerophosphatase A [Aeoliella sp. ICT_H6.2]|uniref:Phosphatidylglycerophosphatase A n=1 Tax=Aeoliella straminimaris TaxID=2954799 RepID=A0A9X2JHI0_9BACT|nr:phosphatidylglycerophosphatase A [Aeoliella straminimaris]MCO6042929.1 phosphatidylglycerophosphatase A [Aeoliella straminimaris]
MTPDEPAAPRRYTLAVWLASGLGVGLFARAPGTFGAIWGLPLAWAYFQLPGVWTWVAAAMVVALGVPVCDRAARDLAMKDPGPVVWDEFATVPLVFLLVPLSGIPVMSDIWIALTGFGLHRAFDITKPWPCNRLERLPGGWGIMADDIAAALYAAVTLWVLVWAFGAWYG